MSDLQTYAKQKNIEVVCYQSSVEGLLVDCVHSVVDRSFDGIVINAGAYSHTSIALQDALRGSGLPAVEVHLSHVHRRETFRHHSMIAAGCIGFVSGFGAKSYHLALDGLADHIQSRGGMNS